MSESRNAANKALSAILASLNHLKLDEKVFDIGTRRSTFGASSDVYRGKLRRADGSFIEVAVKKMRIRCAGPG